MRELISVSEAERLVFDRMPVLPAVAVPLAQAAGRVLREQVVAARDHPPFDRVMMDGVAVNTAGLLDRGKTLEVAGIQAAGEAPQTLPSKGHCLEIMTGAMLPAGCDAVVPVERIHVEDGLVHIAADHAVEPGQYIHPAGSDRRAGSILLEPGQRLNGPRIAVLASEGYAEVNVAACPRICVIATGNELVPVESEPLPHQIRMSNAPAIVAALQLAGWENVTTRHLVDDPGILQREFEKLLNEHDILVLSGGVSKGRYDYVPEVLAGLGVSADFHGIRQRPGKPMWFGGRDIDRKIVFALPGNPVSSLVCLHRYVLPALLVAADAQVGPMTVRLAEPFVFKPQMTAFVPVNLVGEPSGATVAIPQPTHTSGDFMSLASSDGFVELAENLETFEAGFAADLYKWSR